MARPQEYVQPRVDTKVRLTADHARLLKAAQEERGLGRNRLIEMALDEFFNGKGKRPRLKKTDPGQAIAGPAASTDRPARHAPRVAQIGKGIEEASTERQEAVTPRFKEQAGTTRVTPRSRRVAR